MYDRVMKRLADIMMVIAVAALLLAIVLNAVEIFRRYFFSKSIYWIQDVTLLCMMWFIFPGMVKISYQGSDVFVDLFLQRFPKKIQRLIGVINNILVTIICAVLFYYSFNLLIMRLGNRMLTSEIPYFWYTLAMVVVFFLMTLVYLEKVVNALRRKKPEGGEKR